MKLSHLWLRFFLGGFIVVVAMLIVTLLTPRPYGDLSRLGRMSETDFGWTRRPLVLADSEVQAVPPPQADILVIGDSFSMTHHWQSELVRAGYRFTIIYWGDIREALCGDLQSWLEAAGFHGKLIVIESVERLLKQRLKNSDECARMTTSFRSQEKPFFPALEQAPDFAFNTQATLATGLITGYHTWQAARTRTDMSFEVDTRVGLVDKGCVQFSHKLCDRALFLEQDMLNELDLTDFERLVRFDSRHDSTPILWMLIPNKTTVYQLPERSKAFNDALVAKGLGPDIFKLAAENRFNVQDLYFANDTHMSTHGQRLMGRLMLEAVRQRLPMPSPRL
jgi:hypothetical protein